MLGIGNCWWWSWRWKNGVTGWGGRTTKTWLASEQLVDWTPGKLGALFFGRFDFTLSYRPRSKNGKHHIAWGRRARKRPQNISCLPLEWSPWFLGESRRKSERPSSLNLTQVLALRANCLSQLQSRQGSYNGHTPPSWPAIQVSPARWPFYAEGFGASHGSRYPGVCLHLYCLRTEQDVKPAQLWSASAPTHPQTSLVPHRLGLHHRLASFQR